MNPNKRNPYDAGKKKAGFVAEVLYYGIIKTFFLVLDVSMV